MTNHATGHVAEKHVAAHLAAQGYTIVAVNWKTARCEIDIVASKHKQLYFIEVKHRTSDTQGSGLEYITPTKERQMRFAAMVWMQTYSYSGPSEVAAIEVYGPHFEIGEMVLV